MRYLATITLLILALALVQPVAAQKIKPDVSAGVDSYRQEDYATALKHFRPLARQGHINAQFWLGAMYRKGDGVTQDDGEAARCLNNRETLYRLG